MDNTSNNNNNDGEKILSMDPQGTALANYATTQQERSNQVPAAVLPPKKAAAAIKEVTSSGESTEYLSLEERQVEFSMMASDDDNNDNNATKSKSSQQRVSLTGLDLDHRTAKMVSSFLTDIQSSTPEGAPTNKNDKSSLEAVQEKQEAVVEATEKQEAVVEATEKQEEAVKQQPVVVDEVNTQEDELAQKVRERKDRKERIKTEMAEILKKVQETELAEYDEETMEPEAIEALYKAAFKLCYLKKYYDVFRDTFVYFPTTASTIMSYALMEEAEKYYFDEDDEFPMQYSGALRSYISTLAIEQEEAGGEDGPEDDEVYMDALAMELDLGSDSEGDGNGETNDNNDEQEQAPTPVIVQDTSELTEESGDEDDTHEEQEETEEDKQQKRDERKNRKIRIYNELSKLIVKAEEDELNLQDEEEEEDEMELASVEALTKAALKICYLKKYYDVHKDQFICFPSVSKTVMDYTLIEEAEKYYYDEGDEFPMDYSAAIRSVVTTQAIEAEAAGDDDGDQDEDYMAALAMDLDLEEDEGEASIEEVAVAAKALLERNKVRLEAKNDTTKLEAEKAAAKQKAEEEKVRIAEAEAKLKAEEEEKARLAAEAEAELKAEEEEKAQLAAEAEAKQKAEAEETARLAAEAEAKLKAEETARLAVEAKVKAEAEETARLAAEAKQKAEAEETARLAAEAAAKQKSEEEDKARLAAEAETKLKTDEAEKVRLAAEVAAKQKAEAAEKARVAAEGEAKKKAEAEKIRLVTEAAAKQKAAREKARLAIDTETKEKDEARLAAIRAVEQKAELAFVKKKEEDALQPDADPVSRGIATNGADHFPTNKKLVMLISNSSGNRTQTSNQQKILTLIQANGIKPELIDGSDPVNKHRRDELFAVSGIRGNYPQCFIVDGDDTQFLGNSETIESMNDSGKLTRKVLLTPSKASNGSNTKKEETAKSIPSNGSSKKAEAVSATAPTTPSAPKFSGSGSTVHKNVLVLMSTSSGNRTQATDQTRAMALLRAQGVEPETLDASAPENKDRRNELFGISGIRGNFPQVFLVDGNTTSFFGKFETIETMNEMGTLKWSILGSSEEKASNAAAAATTPSIATPATVAAPKITINNQTPPPKPAAASVQSVPIPQSEPTPAMPVTEEKENTIGKSIDQPLNDKPESSAAEQEPEPEKPAVQKKPKQKKGKSKSPIRSRGPLQEQNNRKNKKGHKGGSKAESKTRGLTLPDEDFDEDETLNRLIQSNKETEKFFGMSPLAIGAVAASIIVGAYLKFSG